MGTGDFVTFDDQMLLPAGGAFATLADGLADIEARRPSAERFASDVDAFHFEAIQRELSRMLAGGVSLDERRRHVRIPCDLWVRVVYRDQVRPGVVEDMGIGGVFVSSLVRPRVGDPVELVIEAKEGVVESPLHCTGRATWLGPPSRTGFGLAFDAMDEDSLADIRRLVAVLVRRRAPAWE